MIEMLMGILLSIFKIIGIILLVILAVFLLILFYLLILPISYRVFGAYSGSDVGEGYVCVYDPLRLLKLTFSITGKETETSVRLLWGLIGNEKEKEEEEHEPVEDDRHDLQGDIIDDIEEGNKDFKIEETDEIEAAEKSENINEAEAVNEIEDVDETEDIVDTEDEGYIEDEYFSDEKQNTKEPLEEPSGLTKLNNMVSDERNQMAVRFVLERLIKLLKRIAPHIKSADVDFSAGSPDITGEITGVVAMCPQAYGRSVNISPDFTGDELYAVGHIHLIGRIQLCFVLAYAIQIILNKNCRRLYKQIKH